MATVVRLSSRVHEAVRVHLLHDDSERAAFLFTKTDLRSGRCTLEVIDHYLVPEDELAGGGKRWPRGVGQGKRLVK